MRFILIPLMQPNSALQRNIMTWNTPSRFTGYPARVYQIPVGGLPVTREAAVICNISGVAFIVVFPAAVRGGKGRGTVTP
jgi:hypothetical protein